MEGIPRIAPRAESATDRPVLAMSAAMRQAREQAAALIQLVANAHASDGKGQHVSYKA